MYIGVNFNQNKKNPKKETNFLLKHYKTKKREKEVERKYKSVDASVIVVKSQLVPNTDSQSRMTTRLCEMNMGHRGILSNNVLAGTCKQRIHSVSGFC